MAAASGAANPSLRRGGLEDRLFAEPYSFEFFQAVRLLRRFYPNRSSVGHFQTPRSEIVRFGVHPSLAFPASQIQELEQRQDGPPLMRVNFMGAVGPLGVLPLYYTELVADRMIARDPALRDFLDIFHHRLISLFYRAWQKYHFPVAFEQGEGDKFSHYLLDIVGLGTPGLQDRQRFPDQALVFYGGLLAQQPRSAEGLQLLLTDYFGVKVQIEQFLGAWYRLDMDAQCALDDEPSAASQLGFGATVGDEVWDQQSRVRVVLGPLRLNHYLSFLPTGESYSRLRQIVRFFAGDELDFEVQLILASEDVPELELGGSGEAKPQLGWVSWSKTRKLEYNPSETILQL
ncbi:MAG: type VI secretion system baseplate subunit TssG [Acidobacteriaceae bacterium]|nr:type VI secretion system baseplate subunit TssG [Acidobacteriaceae bacterium]MBV9498076.1 type VI secretion system baseplate subunit TssG [Acidobacteriaceae bacterium]